MDTSIERVSIHGGHSGSFCNHAEDSLEAIVAAYIAKGYTWVGLTEHMPPVNDDFLFPEEREAGLDSDQMSERFERYVRTARDLQGAHAQEIDLLVAMEVETYPGSITAAKKLLEKHQLDYVLGSIHHVDGIPIDFNQAEYARAAAVAGGITPMYCRYFDQQFEMLTELNPSAVGHFDLIRIFDPDYPQRICRPEVWQRVMRNLEYIHDQGMILDINLRALFKGAADPYPCMPILRQIVEMDLAIAPGDDSHGVSTVGACWDTGMKILQGVGIPLLWRRPGWRIQ